MIEFRRDDAGSGPLITGFAGAHFRLDNGSIAASLILTPEKAVPLPFESLDALDTEALLTAIGMTVPPEFLLLGSGPGLRHPPAAFRRELAEQNIGIEVMDSKSAARAWGVLRAEERWIAAALLPFV
jgi:uncharacterized protein